METADILDQTKENVQPLRRGRRVDQLGTVLQAKVNNEAQLELDQQRRQFELAILNYEGDDPLQARYEFVHWIEQSYPTLGPESKLLDLLEDTILQYKNCDKYRQDPRFVEILIKYINSQLNSLELYQLAFNQGLGTMCAIFYEGWAEELEKNMDWKRANQVYETGIMNHAEPLDELKRKHEQFQLSVGRQMLVNDINNPDSPEKSTVVAPPRQALSKLHKSSILGTRLPKGNPGILQAQPSVFGNNQRKIISIYEEDADGNFGGSTSKAHSRNFPKAVIANKENSLKAGPWKNKSSSSSRVRANVPASRTISSTPGFQVHEDEDDKDELPHQTPIVPRVLKPIKNDAAASSNTILEPSDPNVKEMYPKHRIYVGGREFQLEELKAAAYYKKYNINCQEDELGYGSQTPMCFGNQGTSKKPVLASPSSQAPKSVQIRLFADNTPEDDNSFG